MKQINFFKYQDCQIEYLKIDNNTKENLLIIHGFSADFDYYHKFYDYIDSHNIHALNAPFHGNSTGSKSTMNMDYILEVLEFYISSNNLNNLTIIGHSMGGGLAMMLVKKFRHIIKNIILIGPMSRSGLVKTEVFKESFSPRNIKEYEKLANLCYYDPNIVLKNPEYMQMLDNYFKNDQEKLDYIYELGHSLPNLENMDKIDEGIANYKGNLYLLYGDHDGIIDTENISNYYHSLNVDTKTIVFENAGHSPWFEKEKDFFESINFILKS